MFSTAEHRLSLESLSLSLQYSSGQKSFSSVQVQTQEIKEKLEGFSHILANFWSQCLLHHAYLSENTSFTC